MDADQHQHAANATPVDQEAYGWVVRFVSGQARPSDLDALKTWSARSPAHAEAFDRARRIWNALDPARREALSKNVVSFPAVAAPGAAPSFRPGRRAFLGGAIAASIAGGAIVAVRRPLDLWPSLPELTADYRTQTGERRQITVADNVAVEMNTQTSIALRPLPESAERFELISGEALVDASRAGVTVLAARGNISASQALFNIRYLHDTVCVTCLSGRIEVKTPTRTAELSADQQVIYAADRFEDPAEVKPSVVLAWKEGIVIFDRTPISDVILEINRYRHGKVILTNASLGRERFNARFRIENIDRVVGHIAQVFNAKISTFPGGITLIG